MFTKVAEAQTLDIVQKINQQIVDPIIVVLFAAATVYFLFGVFKFLQNADSDTERQTGARHMIYGLFGLFIMVGVYGFLWVICSSIGCR